MAVCLSVVVGATVRSGTTAARITDSTDTVTYQQPFNSPFYGSAAVITDGVYTCPTGTHILLTPTELADLNPFRATSDHYTAVSMVFAAVLTALAVIWGVRRVLALFNSHSEA